MGLIRNRYFQAALFIICLGTLAGLLLSDFMYWKGRYPPDCYFENIEVSGLERAMAMETLEKANVDEAVMGYIVLDKQGRLYKFLPSEIGISINPRRSVRRSADITNRHNMFKRLVKRLSGNMDSTVLPLSLQVDEGIYGSFLRAVAAKTDVASRDAEIALFEGDKYMITAETIGRTLEVEASIKGLQRALDSDLRSATIEVRILYPRVYKKILSRYPPITLLSSFTTRYGTHNSRNRIFNIKSGAAKIDDYILLSGEVFSMVSVIGEVDESSFFKKAFVVKGDSLDAEYGGGICQVSTTLYNAALLAGLETVERHNHGLYFNIYPLGRDATVYGTTKDLKLKNTLRRPVLIKTSATDNSVTVNIYGTPMTGRRIFFTSPIVYIDGRQPVFDTPRLTMDRIRESLDKHRKNAFETVVRVITYQNNRVITEEAIRSRYRFSGYGDNVTIQNPEPIY